VPVAAVTEQVALDEPVEPPARVEALQVGAGLPGLPPPKLQTRVPVGWGSAVTCGVTTAVKVRAPPVCTLLLVTVTVGAARTAEVPNPLAPPREELEEVKAALCA
jgi:hypothetical protein